MASSLLLRTYCQRITPVLSLYHANTSQILRSFITKSSGNRGELSYRKRNNTETQNMTERTTDSPRPSSTLQKNAQVLHVLYGLLDSDRDPTDADAQSLRVLYASS